MRESLAAQVHIMWAGWMQYLFSKSVINKDGTATIPEWAVTRWTRQVNTDYDTLSEEEKDNDRKEADDIIDVLQSLRK